MAKFEVCNCSVRHLSKFCKYTGLARGFHEISIYDYYYILCIHKINIVHVQLLGWYFTRKSG